MADETQAAALPIGAKADAEQSAERKWGADWQAKKLDAYFAELAAAQPEPEITPQTFEWWYALLTVPGREQTAAKRLQRAKLPIYLPLFRKQVRCRGHAHTSRLSPVMPGMLFVPCEIMDIGRRDQFFEWAGVRGYIPTVPGGARETDMDGKPGRMSEDDIELIREIEALVNLPPEAKGVLFEIGQNMHFKNPVYAAFWGAAKIFEIASPTRIGVEVHKLFGRTVRVYVPASEIEAMQPRTAQPAAPGQSAQRR